MEVQVHYLLFLTYSNTVTSKAWFGVVFSTTVTPTGQFCIEKWSLIPCLLHRAAGFWHALVSKHFIPFAKFSPCLWVLIDPSHYTSISLTLPIKATLFSIGLFLVAIVHPHLPCPETPQAESNIPGPPDESSAGLIFTAPTSCGQLTPTDGHSGQVQAFWTLGALIPRPYTVSHGQELSLLCGLILG